MTIGPWNVLAIGVAAIVALMLTFVWFTVLFRAPYIADLGRSAEELARGPSGVVASVYQLLGFLIAATALDWLMRRTGLQGAAQGLLLAIIVWTGFVAATLGPLYAYQAFSLRFFAIVSGGYLAALAAMGLIVGMWRS